MAGGSVGNDMLSGGADNGGTVVHTARRVHHDEVCDGAGVPYGHVEGESQRTRQHLCARLDIHQGDRRHATHRAVAHSVPRPMEDRHGVSAPRGLGTTTLPCREES